MAVDLRAVIIGALVVLLAIDDSIQPSVGAEDGAPILF
jgi:hypothetical protein